MFLLLLASRDYDDLSLIHPNELALESRGKIILKCHTVVATFVSMKNYFLLHLFHVKRVSITRVMVK